jgi:hypothetical protein
MKYLFLLFITLPFCTHAQGDWQVFTSIDGKFKIHTPSELKENVDTLTTAIGLLAYHTFYYQPKTNQDFNEMYMVSYVDYPEGGMHSDSTLLLEDFFENTIEAAVETVKGELRYNSELNDLEYPGRLWRIDYLEGKAIMKTRAFLVNNRYYSIQTIAFKNKHLNSLTDRFMDSFELL